MAIKKTKNPTKSRGLRNLHLENEISYIDALNSNIFSLDIKELDNMEISKNQSEIEEKIAVFGDAENKENDSNKIIKSDTNSQLNKTPSKLSPLEIEKSKRTNFYQRMKTLKNINSKRRKKSESKDKMAICLENLESFMNGNRSSVNFLRNSSELQKTFKKYRQEKLDMLTAKKKQLLEEIHKNYVYCVSKIKESKTDVESSPFINLLIGLKNPYDGPTIIRKSKYETAEKTNINDPITITIGDQSVVFEGNEVLLDGNKVNLKNHALLKDMKDLIAKYKKKGNLKKI